MPIDPTELMPSVDMIIDGQTMTFPLYGDEASAGLDAGSYAIPADNLDLSSGWRAPYEGGYLGDNGSMKIYAAQTEPTAGKITAGYTDRRAYHLAEPGVFPWLWFIVAVAIIIIAMVAIISYAGYSALTYAINKVTEVENTPVAGDDCWTITRIGTSTQYFNKCTGETVEGPKGESVFTWITEPLKIVAWVAAGGVALFVGYKLISSVMRDRQNRPPPPKERTHIPGE